MVFALLLAWSKLRAAAEGDTTFTVGRHTYSSLEDYRAAEESIREAASSTDDGLEAGIYDEDDADKDADCVWPCDAAMISWIEHVAKTQNRSDLRTTMFIYLMMACVPSWIATLLTCGHYGIRLFPWFVVVWALVDLTWLALYYCIRFGSGIACMMFRHTRIHRGFYQCAARVAPLCAGSGGFVERMAAHVVRKATRHPLPPDGDGVTIESDGEDAVGAAGDDAARKKDAPREGKDETAP